MILKYDTGGRGDLSKRIVEAPGVVFYARHWHLIARCHQRKAFRDLRLDRMREWEDLKETYSGHEDFSVIDFIQECEDEVKLVPVVIDCENWVLELALAERPVRVEKKREMPGERTRITGKGYSLE
ncbi:WYL domain-containing protein [bacterium]|nr:WYL domain-containing protein [bacterium]